MPGPNEAPRCSRRALLALCVAPARLRVASTPIPARIVSGGQTGVDRAALDAAIALGVAHGGWVPRGRLAEDGPIAPAYTGLVESASERPALRTALNVRDSDATLILARGAPRGGTALTARCAHSYGKPLLVVDLSRGDFAVAVREIRRWLARTRPATLNVAGPRASEDPLIYARARRIVDALLRQRCDASAAADARPWRGPAGTRGAPAPTATHRHGTTTAPPLPQARRRRNHDRHQGAPT